MKVSAAVMTLLFSVNGFAAGQKVCTSEGFKARATILETSEGVEITITDKNASKMGEVGREKKFEGFFKASNTILLKKATLADALDKNLLNSVMFSLVLSMPDDGENDLASMYASELASKMQCD
jgi:esterase/lipase superfamily enzyme